MPLVQRDQHHRVASSHVVGLVIVHAQQQNIQHLIIVIQAVLLIGLALHDLAALTALFVRILRNHGRRALRLIRHIMVPGQQAVCIQNHAARRDEQHTEQSDHNAGNQPFFAFFHFLSFGRRLGRLSCIRIQIDHFLLFLSVGQQIPLPFSLIFLHERTHPFCFVLSTRGKTPRGGEILSDCSIICLSAFPLIL